MTALERKQVTENLLKEFNIILQDELPPLEEEDSIAMRSAREVAERIVILVHLSCAGQQEYLREEVIDFLKRENLWDAVSPQEKSFFTKTELTEDDKLIIAWRSEAILLLLWAAKKIETLGLPIDEADVNELFNVLPAFLQTVQEFIQAASLRHVSEILDQSDFAFRAQWASQKSAIETFPFHPGILYERYHALNWLTGIEGEWE